MFKKVMWISLVPISLAAIYLAAWPVGIEPVIWQVPPNPGYTGVHAVNSRLSGIETFSIGDNEGPEDIAADP